MNSVEHYRIIKALSVALETSTFLKTLPALTHGYYHLGFHFLAALLTLGLRANPMDVILVLGQVILAAIPIPVFVLIRQETRSDLAAFFSMLLAGFGWYMPGFAVNWGKYPALAGLLALGIVLNLAYQQFERHSRRRDQIILTGWLMLGILVSTLFHTRTLVVTAFALVCWFIAGKMQALAKGLQFLFGGILLIGILVFGTFIYGEPLLHLTLDPYLGNAGLWVTLIVLALSPFALFKFPRTFYFSNLLIFCGFIALFVPIGLPLPGLENQTILDRPFVEMVLYLPLSLLGGLGLAGMVQTLNSFSSNSGKLPSYAPKLKAILLASVAGIFAIGGYHFYPSDCCNLVKYDDTIALDWIEKNLPPDARILVAASELNVLPIGPAEDLAGTDAGLWIPALTGRKISLASFDVDFRASSTWKQLCQERVDYIYAGGMDQSFHNAQLNEKTTWYERVLFLPEAHLFQLTGCTE